MGGYFHQDGSVPNYKHGYSRIGKVMPEYSVWNAMINRCKNPNNKHYADYGGRGILVCARWQDGFINFLEDMGERPSNKYTLERVDNNKGYSAENCKWATVEEQARNRRNNILIEYNGTIKTLNAWCVTLNVKYPFIVSRLNKEIPMKEIVIAAYTLRKPNIRYSFGHIN